MHVNIFHCWLLLPHVHKLVKLKKRDFMTVLLLKLIHAILFMVCSRAVAFFSSDDFLLSLSLVAWIAFFDYVHPSKKFLRILGILAKIRDSWSTFKILGQDVTQYVFQHFKTSSKICAIIVCVIANSTIAVE